MTGKRWLLALVMWVPVMSMAGEKVTVAVASNFIQAARELAVLFEQETGHEVLFSASSSGKLYAQISHGAPFDVFLSADAERPRLLAEQGLAVPASRFTYARGQLTLWSVDERYQDGQCDEALKAGEFDRLAIANPRTAPYGVAAEQALTAMGLDPASMASRIATGESIAQTMQFVASRSASMGFVATAQLALPDIPEGTCHWPVPQDFYQPIEQQAVLLTRSRENPGAVGFMAFLTSEAALSVIRANGYGL